MTAIFVIAAVVAVCALGMGVFCVTMLARLCVIEPLAARRHRKAMADRDENRSER